MSILPCSTFISPGNPFYGSGGGVVPIIPPASYRTTVILGGGENATGTVLDASNPALFPPNTSYAFTMTGSFSSEGESTCDTSIGQLYATGLFSILTNGSVGFLSGSAVNTLAPSFINPGNFYFNSPGNSITIVTTSASDFNGCTFQFVCTQVTQI